MSPLEMVRTHVQAYSKHQESNLSATLRAEGFRGLWRGLTATLFRDVPFSGNERRRRRSKRSRRRRSKLAGSQSLIGVFVACLFCLFCLIVSFLFLFLPAAPIVAQGLYWMGYESFKLLLHPAANSTDLVEAKPPFHVALVSGALSGMVSLRVPHEQATSNRAFNVLCSRFARVLQIAAALTLPFDVVKTHLQSRIGDGKPSGKKKIIERKAEREEERKNER